MHHAFLAALLFIDSPEKVLLAGLGGGALARYLHHINSDIQGDAVEVNETITAVAKSFFCFPETKWNISIENIQQWQGSAYDLVIADIAQADLTPTWLISEEMILCFKQQLSANGVLVMNLLVTDAQSLSRTLKIIRETFARRTLCLTVPDHKNIVVFAFNQQPRYHSKNEINSRISQLAEKWQLDFYSLLDQLLKDNPEGSGIF